MSAAVPGSGGAGPLRVRCLVNAEAGAAGTGEALARAFARVRAAGPALDLEVEACRGASLEAGIERALRKRPHVLAAAGGDGTLSAVAHRLAGSGVALGVIPLGTLNHFARDLGIPLELERAVEVVCRGRTAAIDLGEVNGRHFLNNTSVGLYSEMVRVRERLRPRLSKRAALLVGSLRVLRRLPTLAVEVEADGERIAGRVPLLWIGNNVYDLAWPSVGRRERLDAGCLNLWLATATDRRSLLRAALHVLRGREAAAPHVRSSCVRRVVLHGRAHRALRIAVDGELLRMEPPLVWRVRARALLVRLPAGSAAGASAPRARAPIMRRR